MSPAGGLAWCRPRGWCMRGGWANWKAVHSSCAFQPWLPVKQVVVPCILSPTNCSVIAYPKARRRTSACRRLLAAFLPCFVPPPGARSPAPSLRCQGGRHTPSSQVGGSRGRTLHALRAFRTLHAALRLCCHHRRAQLPRLCCHLGNGQSHGCQGTLRQEGSGPTQLRR